MRDDAGGLDSELPRCAVVGAGRLGTALLSALRDASGPYGRGYDGGDHEVVLLAVPDRAIASAAAAITVRSGRLVGHCSGATTIDVLEPHERFGLHPLMTFSERPDVAGGTSFVGAYAAVAGSTTRAGEMAATLARGLGMEPFAIREGDRAAYHAAASFASNFLVTIEDAAEELLGAADIDRRILLPLVRATVESWGETGRAALTGPVARGDEATVDRQRAAIADLVPDVLALFEVLVARTREIARAAD